MQSKTRDIALPTLSVSSRVNITRVMACSGLLWAESEDAVLGVYSPGYTRCNVGLVVTPRIPDEEFAKIVAIGIAVLQVRERRTKFEWDNGMDQKYRDQAWWELDRQTNRALRFQECCHDRWIWLAVSSL